MNKFIFIISLAFTKVIANATRRSDCDGLIYDDVYNEREVIKTGLGKPINLVLHKDSDLLFFSHTTTNKNRTDFVAMTCHIIKKECVEITGMDGGFAVAYDQGNDDIYLGGESGIYRYNFLSQSADFFSEAGTSIWSIFIGKKFYYIEYPSQRLYVYYNDEFTPVEAAKDIQIDNFFVSKANNVYYSNKTAMFKIEQFSRESILLDARITVRQISEDNLGDIYICAKDGIYSETRLFDGLKKLADIENAYGLSFDENNNAIYSDENGIYKLTPNDDNYMCKHQYGYNKYIA